MNYAFSQGVVYIRLHGNSLLGRVVKRTTGGKRGSREKINGTVIGPVKSERESSGFTES